MRHSDLFSSSRFRLVLAVGGTLAIAGAAVVTSGAMKPAIAGCLVNTGPSVGGTGTNYSFNSRQQFAGEFTVTKSSVITNIMGWFGIGQNSPPGEVRISLHADGGNVPGATLYSQSFAPDPNWISFHFGAEPDPNPKWQGISDLNWTIQPGTYWASFAPDQNYSGLMPGQVEKPMDNYAVNQGSGWKPLDAPGVGVQLSGDSFHSQSISGL